ncbi:30S ribosomal protein S6 [Candidatus Dojkabacteria bacterium]|nr:30S ribosomal protein S6 [Candidatus Dojkabacteria bacterium]
MVIFKPLLPDDVRKNAHTIILDAVKKLGGDVVGADVWGKRYLSYPIKKHEEGYYIVYELKIPSSGLSEIEVALSRITEVLRYLITRINSPEEKGKNLNKKVIDI